MRATTRRSTRKFWPSSGRPPTVRRDDEDMREPALRIDRDGNPDRARAAEQACSEDQLRGARARRHGRMHPHMTITLPPAATGFRAHRRRAHRRADQRPAAGRAGRHRARAAARRPPAVDAPGLFGEACPGGWAGLPGRGRPDRRVRAGRGTAEPSCGTVTERIRPWPPQGLLAASGIWLPLAHPVCARAPLVGPRNRSTGSVSRERVCEACGSPPSSTRRLRRRLWGASRAGQPSCVLGPAHDRQLGAFPGCFWSVFAPKP
jgi:hypothetical protein